MSYKYDLFVSYMHDEVMGDWVPQHLVPFLTTFVGNALNKRASIFVDRTGIALRLHEPGMSCTVRAWTDTSRKGSSRCTRRTR